MPQKYMGKYTQKNKINKLGDFLNEWGDFFNERVKKDVADRF